MPPASTNWTPGLLVLAFGVVVAMLYVFLSKQRSAAKAATASRDDVAARYQTTLSELKEHIANKHLLPELVWEAEKKRLEALAVALLKERDGSTHETLKAQARAEKKAQAQASDSSFFAKSPAIKGALVGGGVVFFFAFLWFTVNEAAKPRSDSMQVTGMTPESSGPSRGENPSDQKLESLLAAVEKSPNDVEVLAEAGLYLIRRQGFNEARRFINQAVLLDPFHVKTRVGRAVIQAVDGDIAAAQLDLERLASLYPDAYAANLYAGMLALEENNSSRALKNFEAYLEAAPPGEVPPMMRGAVAQLRQQVATP